MNDELCCLVGDVSMGWAIIAAPIAVASVVIALVRALRTSKPVATDPAPML